jgi:hypothetical protein
VLHSAGPLLLSETFPVGKTRCSGREVIVAAPLDYRMNKDGNVAKNAVSSVKKPVGASTIIAVIAGLFVLLGIFYFVFIRSSDPGASSGKNTAPPPDAAASPAVQPNMPQPPPGDTDKEHVGPDTSGAPR